MDMTLSEWFETQSFPAEEKNLASSASLYLKKGAGRSLKSGGEWVYDNEVDRTEGSFNNGAILSGTASSTRHPESASGCSQDMKKMESPPLF